MILMLTCFAICVTAVLSAEVASAQLPAKQEHGDYVVLLHGMGRTAMSMKRLEHHLTKRGFRVINATYRSRKMPVEKLAETFLTPLLQQNIKDPTAKVNFVTHSLGGIIVRQYLSNHALENQGRIVMLAPPNHGSEIIDWLRANPISRVFMGAASLELGTSADDLPRRLGAVRFDCGVIAGDRSLNPLLSAMLTGANDGKVTVESAKIAGMRDFLVMHSGHTWLMWRERTLHQIDCFLEHGRFDHGSHSKF